MIFKLLFPFQFVDVKFNPNHAIESKSGVIILNSFLSSSAGALTACLLARIITHQWSLYRLFGGALAGWSKFLNFF
jgi:ammonia channel protein AmtB